MGIYRFADIREVHLEMTNRCNSACPMCPRNYFGGRTRYGIQLTELSLADLRTIFPVPFLRQLHKILVNGNFGDACAARSSLEAFEYFKNSNPQIHLKFHTNGGLQSTDWWKRVASVVDSVEFSIDGLDDTHSLYRRHTKYEVVLRNAVSFIQGGGKATWMFTVFRHNQHQVEEARATAQRLGFAEFVVRKTDRFEWLGKIMLRKPVYNLQGDFEYAIELPDDLRYQNANYEGKPRGELKYDSNISGAWEDDQKAQEQYLQGTWRPKVTADEHRYHAGLQVRCQVQRKGSIFVDCHGYVFPCCWLSKPPFQATKDFTNHQIMQLVQETGGLERLHAKIYPIEEIVASEFFQAVQNSWSKANPEEGKLMACTRSCSESANSFQSQFL